MATFPTQQSIPPDGDLPKDGPVNMPPLPPKLVLTTEQQLKAIADPLRSRILVLLQHQPATAKQIADRLGIVPGTIGHHLQVLEDAGLVQVVARRLVHGIVAKYYTRAARVFFMEFPSEVMGADSINVELLTDARNELAEALGTIGEQAILDGGFPHARLSVERAQFYQQRLASLLDEFISEPPDPGGQVYAFSVALFLAPPTLQVASLEGEDGSAPASGDSTNP